MKARHLRLATAVAVLGLCHLAAAQPDVNNAPKGANPQNRRPADVAQRKQMAADERVRTQLKKLGLTDEKQLDVLVAFIQGEITAREAVTDKGSKLSQVLKNDALTTGQVAAALNDYQAVLDDDKTRHDAAVAALEKKVDLTKIPRVEAWLTLTGTIGNGPVVIAGGMGGRRARVRETVKVNGKDLDAAVPMKAAP